MVNVIAATSFFGTSAEGMWLAGDTKRVSDHRAHELIEEGLAIEAQDQSEPSALQQAADAIGATVDNGEQQQASLDAAAEALNAKPVTSDSMKGKRKPKPFEDRETKEEGPAPETK